MPKKFIAKRNVSPHGWWIGTFVERFVLNSESRTDLARRCHAYENTVILQAGNREEAHAKLRNIGRSSCQTTESGPLGISGHDGRWRFEGIVELLPIYDPLQDGAEVLWRHHRNVSIKTVRSMVRPKRALPVFDDSE